MKIDFEKLESELSKLADVEVYEPSYLNECYKKSLIDIDTSYGTDTFILNFIEEHGDKTPVMSLGNISTTIGGAKSKKTFYSTMIASSFCGCDKFALNGNLLGRKLLYVDTEQSKYHVQKILARVKVLSNNLNDIDIISLRDFDSQDLRLAIIEYILRNNKLKYSIVIIDGIVDLVKDYNNLAECSRIVSKLMSWSSIYNLHINNIVHVNKNSPHARGHLGNELMNKSETIFRVHKDDEVFSTVSCEASRNKGFKKFTFRIDQDGLPKRDEFPTGYFNNSPCKSELLNYKEKTNIDFERAFESEGEAPF